MKYYGNRPNDMFSNLKDNLNDGVEYLFLNIFWFIFSLPIITIFPATGALYYATNELAHKRIGDFSVFWEGFKKYLWTSYKWGLLLIISGYLIYMNIWFYARLDWQYGDIVCMFFVGLAVIWAAVMVYVYPFLLEQEKPALITAVRNSFVVVSRSPLRAFGVVILIAVIFWISIYIFLPLWLIISMSLITYLSNRGTLWILDTIPKSGEKTEEQEES